MVDLSNTGFAYVRFVRDYYALNHFDEPDHKKGEVTQVRAWLAKELVDLGYAVWERNK